MASKLFFGHVMHQRLMPMAYRFSYRIFGLLIDIDAIEQEAASLKWLSVDMMGSSAMCHSHSCMLLFWVCCLRWWEWLETCLNP